MSSNVAASAATYYRYLDGGDECTDFDVVAFKYMLSYPKKDWHRIYTELSAARETIGEVYANPFNHEAFIDMITKGDTGFIDIDLMLCPDQGIKDTKFFKLISALSEEPFLLSHCGYILEQYILEGQTVSFPFGSSEETPIPASGFEFPVLLEEQLYREFSANPLEILLEAEPYLDPDSRYTCAIREYRFVFTAKLSEHLKARELNLEIRSDAFGTPSLVINGGAAALRLNAAVWNKVCKYMPTNGTTKDFISGIKALNKSASLGSKNRNT